MRTLLKTLIILLFTVGSFQTARGQSVDLNGEIFEYATYYVNNFDLGTGATNVQIFRYQLSSNDYPVSIKYASEALLLSPALGINNEQTIVEIETDAFQLQAPIILDNRDISSETSVIYDMDSPPNTIEMTGQVVKVLNPPKQMLYYKVLLQQVRLQTVNIRFKSTYFLITIKYLHRILRRF